jgi:hypothetical protein
MFFYWGLKFLVLEHYLHKKAKGLACCSFLRYGAVLLWYTLGAIFIFIEFFSDESKEFSLTDVFLTESTYKKERYEGDTTK